MTLRHRLYRSLPHRTWWMVVLGLVFCVVITLNIRQAYHERDAAKHFQRSNPWAAWQLEREYMRFLLAVHLFEEEPSQAALDELQVRFEILYSRPTVILRGSETSIVRSIPGVTTMVEELVDKLDAIDPRIYALQVGNSSSAGQLHDELEPLLENLGKISVAAHSGARVTESRDAMQAMQERSQWMQALLVGTSAVVVIVLMVEVQRNRRLARAETRLRKLADMSSQALQEGERRYRHLVESTGAIPYSLDLSTMSFSYVGPQAETLLGYPLSEWSRPDFWAAHLHDDDRDTAIDERLQEVQQYDDIDLDYRMVDSKGRAVWVRDVMKVRREANGRLIGYGLLFDNTLAKRRDRELVSAQKMEAVGRLTGGMAHDFNNLLTVVIGNLELAQRKLPRDDRLQRFLDRARTAAQRGAGLTRQLLGFARRQALEPLDFDANELVSTTLDLMSRTLGEHVDISANLDPDLWQVYADPVQVESAITNLAINGRDAMPNGGRLSVETANRHIADDFGDDAHKAPAGDYVMIAVSDTGTGMPPEVLARVFEPFFTTKGDGKGTGLGLSMVFGFVRQSRGHVEIESELGHGTTVRIYLPRGRICHRAEEKNVADDIEVSFAGLRVLIVEDNCGVRETAVARLHDLGCETVVADSGPAGLRIVEADDGLDLLFTDIVMPGGMSGIELAEAAVRLRPGLKVLFTSGFYNDSGDADRRIRDLGILLRKPYREGDLRIKLGEALRRHAGVPSLETEGRASLPANDEEPFADRACA